MDKTQDWGQQFSRVSLQVVIVAPTEDSQNEEGHRLMKRQKWLPRYLSLLHHDMKPPSREHDWNMLNPTHLIPFPWTVGWFFWQFWIPVLFGAIVGEPHTRRFTWEVAIEGSHGWHVEERLDQQGFRDVLHVQTEGQEWSERLKESWAGNQEAWPLVLGSGAISLLRGFNGQWLSPPPVLTFI